MEKQTLCLHLIAQIFLTFLHIAFILMAQLTPCRHIVDDLGNQSLKLGSLGIIGRGKVAYALITYQTIDLLLVTLYRIVNAY